MIIFLQISIFFLFSSGPVVSERELGYEIFLYKSPIIEWLVDENTSPYSQSHALYSYEYGLEFAELSKWALVTFKVTPSAPPPPHPILQLSPLRKSGMKAFMHMNLSAC